MWKFKPIFKTKIWGGARICRMFEKAPADHVGECWTLSGVEGELSEIVGGRDDGMNIRDLIRRDGEDVLGKLNFQRYGDKFPLLIKIIDAADRLSVQVHPDNQIACEIGEGSGKNEMWYFLDCAPDSQIAVGFNRDIDCEEFQSLVNTSEVEKCLNIHSVSEGDVYYIPARTIHSIGRGCLLVEVQQASDSTYRVYDYMRRDEQGQMRELHLDLACMALDFNKSEGGAVNYARVEDIPINLVRTPYFSSNVLDIDKPMLRDYSECDSFVIIICTNGHAMISSVNEAVYLDKGEVVLVPASTDNVNIIPGKKFSGLEVYIK